MIGEGGTIGVEVEGGREDFCWTTHVTMRNQAGANTERQVFISE